MAVQVALMMVLLLIGVGALVLWILKGAREADQEDRDD